VSHVWFIVRWLHLLAMAFFVGGQMVLAAVVVPVGRRTDDRESLRLIARRFGYTTLAALAVLIATGTAMAFHLELWSDGTFQLKLALVVVLGGLRGTSAAQSFTRWRGSSSSADDACRRRVPACRTVCRRAINREEAPWPLVLMAHYSFAAPRHVTDHKA
jgi:uncharacterized membrane protein